MPKLGYLAIVSKKGGALNRAMLALSLLVPWFQVLLDLRRHAATYASRSGVPLEIVSKIILRHSNLSTTQIYLGRISDTEALKWIETIYE